MVSGRVVATTRQRIGADDRIADMPEASFLILMLHLYIGKGGMAAGTPIDKAIIPVDEPLFIETDEDLTNRRGKTCIHGKAFPLPIAGCAKTLELADDLPARTQPSISRHAR